MGKAIAGIMLGLATIGCNERNSETSADSTGMPGMGMAMRSSALMPAMRATLDTVSGARPQEISDRLPRYRLTASEILDAMRADMTMMNMRADGSWISLEDSVRQDLTDLPQHNGDALAARMKAHTERMRRLLDRHQSMMR